MTYELDTTSAFNGVVSALVKIAEGEVELRKHVAAYVTAGGTVKQLHEGLKALDDQRCHKSEGYLRKIQDRCRQVGLLPEQTYHKSKIGLQSPIPVENPEVLSSLLPTQRDVKAYAKAPVAVKEQIVDLSNSSPTPNDAIVEKVRSLINEDFEIDSSSLTEVEKDECLEGLHIRVEALTAHAAFNDQACASAMKEYGFINQEGFWQDHKPLTIIRNLLPELSTDERKQLIDLLISPIN
mgnify:FL=1|tara:strand:- start:5253 stop:5966 length:714 start_codon:yes stop_codon:yes gene_type:complete